MPETEAVASERVNLRVTPDEVTLLEETQELLQRYIAKNAKAYGAEFRVTQRIVVVRALRDLNAQLTELLRERKKPQSGKGVQSPSAPKRGGPGG